MHLHLHLWRRIHKRCLNDLSLDLLLRSSNWKLGSLPAKMAELDRRARVWDMPVGVE